MTSRSMALAPRRAARLVIRASSALLLAASLTACGDSGGPDDARWSTRAPMPVPRVDHAAVALGGKLYVLGGYSGSTLARVDMYDPATDTWTRRADMLTPRREFAAGVIDGRIHVATGMQYSDPNGVTYVAAAEVYDPATDRWTTRAAHPGIEGPNSVYSNAHITGGAVSGRLYVTAFSTTLPGLTASWGYDPAADRWSARAASPFSYHRLASTTLDGSLYLLASAPGQVRFARFDAGDNIWVVQAPPSGPGHSALAAADGRVFALGGVSEGAGGRPGSLSRGVRVFDAASNRWGTFGAMRVARHSAAAAVVGDSIYVTGGSTSNNRMQPLPSAVVESAPLP